VSHCNEKRYGWMACALALGLTLTGVAAAQTTVCGNNNLGPLGDQKQYIFLGDQWNKQFAKVKQCLQVTDSHEPAPHGPSSVYTGEPFQNTTWTPSDYPDFLYGCFHGTCTENTHLPIQVSHLDDWSITSGETVVQPAGFNNDMAYDIWFNQGPESPIDKNTTGTELMIWVQHSGPAQPIGKPAAQYTDTRGHHWTAWVGPNTGNCNCQGPGSQVISFVNDDGHGATKGTTYDLNLNDFFHVALKLGQIQPGWYLTAVEFGTEIWSGGPGLHVDNFWVKVEPQTAAHAATSAPVSSITAQGR